ncbi:MAG: RNHCP domain-containing protein [Oscillospiraceae bacterium]|nr:RNHCP domain-containing protein [Oscillospiraceae bacterium]
MKNKRFTKNDGGFICQNCKKTVPPLLYSSRNHCPFCLYSLHLDIMPGDRANGCGGVLEPFFTLPDRKKGYIIEFKCLKCGCRTRSKAAKDDNTDLLIELTNPERE